ncbi:right-handed parallel beta-helix repeat-containing protein [Mucilaginibacter jinjuensis]|uniref:Right-handed parallel beta-helix repeat-containing protein n=1 Tax=Mucilaginibacter jinjuensis TaxID=1176721 RepID=A0ABY7T2Q3_9SPHI|nr:right-handed parallel beta-helix repeat-containing protein [Mucilaginibacter jinjuensis]WCT10730.1 right-handed parallel beta-helix repeat-containing protein [Mucilaginibacter jinjuensis]
MKNTPYLRSLLSKLNPNVGLFIAVILFGYNQSYGSTYYISSSAGNDAYTDVQAHNPSTPWKSLDKLNTYFKLLGAGDSVLFKRGEIFYGTIAVAKSGAVFAPIYFGAYGNGNTPQINGLTTLKYWKLVKNGIYESPCVTDGSMLVLNGVQQAIGRYPNKGYLTYKSHQGNTSITNNQPGDLNNWTGSEVVIRKNRWIIDKSAITSDAGGIISYAAGTKDMPTNGFGYFIQKSAKTLDQFGEWYYDASRKMMMVYLGNRNPENFIIQTNAETNLVNITKFNNIVFENLSFIGAGNNAFNITNSNKIILRHCNIDLTGADAVSASYSPFLAVQNCSINHSLSGGVNLDAGCVNSTIINNEIKNTGLIPGMGKNGSGTYEAITSFGDNTQIEKNRIDSTGYNGIYFGGTSSYVKNNYITYFCLTKDDGAAIYIGDWSKTMHKCVIGNIIMHGVGNGTGTVSPLSLQAEGIYIDDNTESVAITGNTISLCANNGIKIHNAKDINIYGNTVFNNGVQLRLEQDHYLTTSSYIRNNNIRNNTFFSLNDLQPNAKFSSQQDDITAFGQIDSNFYCQLKKEISAIMASTVKDGKGVNQTYNLTRWRTAYGKDQFSIELLPYEDIMFEFNVTNEVKTIKLDKPYVDVHHNVYKDKVSIDPFSSIILVANERLAGKTSQNTITDKKGINTYSGPQKVAVAAIANNSF